MLRRNVGNVSIIKGLFTSCGGFVIMLKRFGNKLDYAEDFKERDTNEISGVFMLGLMDKQLEKSNETLLSYMAIAARLLYAQNGTTACVPTIQE